MALKKPQRTLRFTQRKQSYKISVKRCAISVNISVV